ncbi:MAG: type II secretion system protein [Alphaproteobacteria bacterium]|nr:type II secretion system protein [Alphaproteobacteria bacterium]
MSVKNKTNKNDKRSQKGRSMVEMLGVLAIVGVLSVGGVYGYGVAMKKHKANELLHQASMLATTISAQIQSKGELPQSIEDFGNGKYGTFNPPSEANAEQFTMQITGMDSAVCTQMEKMASGMVREAKCNGTTLTLTYNNNLSSDKVAADYNGDEDGCKDSGRKYCSGSNSCVALDKECGCSGTNNGCQKCDTETGSLVADDEKEGENCTTSDGKAGTCNDGVCEEKVDCPNGLDANEEGKCICTDHTTNQCGLGYYCKFVPDDDACGDSDRGDGVCTAVGSGTSIKDGAYLKSSDPMDWWSAYSWCKGNDMDLITGTIDGIPLNSDYFDEDNYILYNYFGEYFKFWTGYEDDHSCYTWYAYAEPDHEWVGSDASRDCEFSALCQ